MAESCGASCKAWFESVGFLRCGRLLEKTPAEAGVLLGGSDRRRSGDLSIFSRTLYQLSYRALTRKPGRDDRAVAVERP